MEWIPKSGAEWLKDLSPSMVETVWQAVYTSRSSVSCGRDTLWRALKVGSRILKSIHKPTGSQWSVLRTGVMFCVED